MKSGVHELQRDAYLCRHVHRPHRCGDTLYIYTNKSWEPMVECEECGKIGKLVIEAIAIGQDGYYGMYYHGEW